MFPLVFLIFLSYLNLMAALSPADAEASKRLSARRPKLTLYQDLDYVLGVLRHPQTRAQFMLPVNPYAKNVKLTLCGAPEEQEQSRLLIAELMTNEVAAANVEAFDIGYFYCVDDDDGGCGCGDMLGTFVELIDRGGSYLKALKRAKWVFCHISRIRVLIEGLGGIARSLCTRHCWRPWKNISRTSNSMWKGVTTLPHSERLPFCTPCMFPSTQASWTPSRPARC